MQNTTKELKAIPLAAYQRCVDEWMKRWHTAQNSKGEVQASHRQLDDISTNHQRWHVSVIDGLYP